MVRQPGGQGYHYAVPRFVPAHYIRSGFDSSGTNHACKSGWLWYGNARLMLCSIFEALLLISEKTISVNLFIVGLVLWFQLSSQTCLPSPLEPERLELRHQIGIRSYCAKELNMANHSVVTFPRFFLAQRDKVFNSGGGTPNSSLCRSPANTHFPVILSPSRFVIPRRVTVTVCIPIVAILFFLPFFLLLRRSPTYGSRRLAMIQRCLNCQN